MKVNKLFLMYLYLFISTTVFSQDIFTNTTYSGLQVSTGDIIIHNGATLTLAPNTLLRMLPNSEILVKPGGSLVVNRSCTIQSFDNSSWDGIRVLPTSTNTSTSLSPAVIMSGGPSNDASNRINIQDADMGIRSFAQFGALYMRGIQLYGVDFTNCSVFIWYQATFSNPDPTSISTGIHSCKFIGSAITSYYPVRFLDVSDLNITASEFLDVHTSPASTALMIDATKNVIVDRNQFTNSGIKIIDIHNNISVSHNSIINPKLSGIELQGAFENSSNVLIRSNKIYGNNSVTNAAITASNLGDLSIERNTISDRQTGIACSSIRENSLILGNDINLCTNAGITIQSTIADTQDDALIIGCNNFTKNATAIRLENQTRLPVHLLEWNGYTINTDPGNRFKDNILDIENQNPNFTWTYHVIDAANLTLNPPITTNGLVNLVDLQNEGRYGCGGLEFAEIPSDASFRDAGSSTLGSAQSSIAPNPAREAFQLTLAEQWQGQQVAIDIIDVSGKVLQQLSTRQYEDSNIRISTQHLQAGYYFCRISGPDQQSEVIKLIVID